MPTIETLTLGEFQLVALNRALRELTALERGAIQAKGQEAFQKRELSPLLINVGPRELAVEVERFSSTHHVQEAARIKRLAAAIAAAMTGLDALRAYYDLVGLPDDPAIEAPIHFSADRLRIYVAIQDDRDDYLAAVSDIYGASRRADRTLTAAEQAALDVADWRVRGGVPLHVPFACLGTAGFRAVQTWLSLADPGPDHARITAQHDDILRGLVVHVEYIDRDMVSDKEKIEPYRLPATWHAARVRLRVGDATPCTAFIGRPIFENHAGASAIAPAEFQMDLLKTVHLHASACTAMFAAGIADCKIAIERMPFSLAKQFMRALAGNVLRDRDRQTLSAAFNINTPLVDDEGSERRVLTDRFEIARRGVELAVAGGFDKVTWDGASNEVPSRPLTEQITHEQLVDLVHLAHSHGLETYISAGMVARHMRDAVNAGVDGVGIGTSMHWVDPETKLMGALKPDAIRAALTVRDEAATTTLGRGAALLARLDQMHFEGSLLPNEERVRGELHAAVRRKDDAAIDACASACARVVALNVVDLRENPILARGRRRLAVERLDPDRAAARDQGALELAVHRADPVIVRELLHGEADGRG